MPRRIGRPRVNLEKKVFESMSAQDKQLEAIIARKLNFNTPSIMAVEAARLLLTIERGADPEAILHTSIFQRINHYASKNGPHGKWLGPRGPRDFLEEFICTHAPGWDWRSEARQGEIEDLKYKSDNQRIAKEHAEDARWQMACTSKFFTPDSPDAFLLQSLAWEWHSKRVNNPHARHWWENYKHYRVIRTTAPTLRELKLATAFPERELKKIMRDLRPKKGEIIKEPLRHKFSKRGAVPLRYGPRLVIGVLNEFLNRLPEFLIDDRERKRLRKTALMVKRAFAARLKRSRQST